VNPFLTDTLAAIRAEAEATKPVYMASSAAVAELIAERVERGILNAAEAAEIADYLAAPAAEVCRECGSHAENGPCPYAADLAAALDADEARDALPEPYMVPAPRCPECGGPADTGAGHDCEV